LLAAPSSIVVGSRRARDPHRVSTLPHEPRSSEPGRGDARFQQLADALPAMVWTARPDGAITWANVPWCDYTGIAADAALAWTDRVLHPDDRGRWTDEWVRAVRDGAEYGIEVRHRRRDGAYRWVLARAVPVGGTAGAPGLWLGTTTEIHGHKEIEEALREADRRKDDFVATLAHELRNPLAPLRNALEILRLQPADPRALAEMWQVMDRQVRQLVRLVDDLLDVSRATRGLVELRRERVALADVIKSAIEMSEPHIAARQHVFTREVPPDPIYVDADPIRLGQVLSNLLNNAAKYTNRGGEIALTARRDGDSVTISVRDSGIGIVGDMLPRVFDIYHQGSSGGSTGGLGIGLTLSRHLVELLGGQIEARSAGLGRGSEFVVRLPAPVDDATVAAPLTPSAARPAPPAGPRRRVLIVEDDPDSADSLRLLLRLRGHDVRLARDGHAALAAARSEPPDVVLLDIALPDMDGYEVARRLRADPALSHLRLVALSGYARAEDLRRAPGAGFDDYLVKPVAPDVLAALVDQPAR
jgi:PAS domain S-box-containing protein